MRSRSRAMHSARRLLVVVAATVLGIGLPTFGPTAGATNPSVSSRNSASLGSPDRTCHHGRPVPLHEAVTYGYSYVDVATIGDVTVVGISSSTARAVRFTLRAFTRDCAVDRSFGHNGVATVQHPSTSRFVAIESMAPGLGHTLLVAGEDGRSWIVGRVLWDGRLDSTFGTGGWTAVNVPESPLPVYGLGGEANSIVQSPEGAIYVGGNDGNAHCCVRAFVVALTSSGHPSSAFGADGWVKVLPQGDYSTQLLLAPDGSLDVVGDVVYGGCGGPQLTALTPTGAIVSTAAAEFESSMWQGISSDGYMDASFVERPGGGLVGVAKASSPCLSRSPRDIGEVVGLLPNGQPDPAFGSGGHTGAPWLDVAGTSLWAVPIAGSSVDTVVEVADDRAPYIPTNIDIRSYSPEGTPKGVGHAVFDLGRASDMTQYPIVDAAPGPAGTIVLVVGSGRGSELYRLIG